jgi:hypothetical protein
MKLKTPVREGTRTGETHKSARSSELLVRHAVAVMLGSLRASARLSRYFEVVQHRGASVPQPILPTQIGGRRALPVIPGSLESSLGPTTNAGQHQNCIDQR